MKRVIILRYAELYLKGKNRGWFENALVNNVQRALAGVEHKFTRQIGRFIISGFDENCAEEIFENPRHPYTIALMSAIPTLTGEKEEQILLEGQVPSPVSPPQGCPFHTRCFMAEKVCQRIPAPIVEVKNGHFAACHFANISTAEKRKIALKQTRD